MYKVYWSNIYITYVNKSEIEILFYQFNQLTLGNIIKENNKKKYLIVSIKKIKTIKSHCRTKERSSKKRKIKLRDSYIIKFQIDRTNYKFYIYISIAKIRRMWGTLLITNCSRLDCSYERGAKFNWNTYDRRFSLTISRGFLREDVGAKPNVHLTEISNP